MFQIFIFYPTFSENWRFNASLFIPPFDSVSFHAPEKGENAYLAITLWGSKKLAILTLELIKKRDSYNNILIPWHVFQFEQSQEKKTMRKIEKAKKRITLDLSLYFGSSNHELWFKLFSFSPDQLVFLQKDAM
jgi:hypothetical protein